MARATFGCDHQEPIKEATTRLSITRLSMAGHDGQSVAILPDENLVIVRLGLTPSELNYKAAKLVNAVVVATK